MPKFKACLTGGIASGKTYVSNKFSALGAYVIDADVLARQVVEPGTPGWSQLVTTFGSEVLRLDETLNREKLKELVFNDNEQLLKLNSILHPLIRSAFQESSNLNQTEIEIWVIPLLTKTSGYRDFNRVVAVDVDEAVQIDRVVKRDEIDEKIARSIIKAQSSREERFALATDVISNNRSFGALDDSIFRIYDVIMKANVLQST